MSGEGRPLKTTLGTRGAPSGLTQQTTPASSTDLATAINEWFFGATAGGATGTLATTNANDTLSAVGTTTPTGSLAETNTNDTLSASGTTTPTGTLAKTNGDDTLVASGTGGATPSGTLAA